MDSVRTNIRANRRESSTDNGEPIREILLARRRKMVRVGDDGVRVCGHSPVLLPSNSGSTSQQERDRATTQRMEQAEGGRTADVHKVSDTDDDSDMFFASRPLQSGGSAIVSGMLSLSVKRTVSFDSRVIVYTPIDWSHNAYREARKGPWMQLAIDRCRFSRRIKESEYALGVTFTEDRRDKVKRRLFCE